jgi:hypothetical protein
VREGSVHVHVISPVSLRNGPLEDAMCMSNHQLLSCGCMFHLVMHPLHLQCTAVCTHALLLV